MSDEEATEAKEESSKTTEVTESEEESEGGLGPALLVGLVILAVVGALVFWPSGDAPQAGKDGAAGGKTASAAQGRGGKADGKGGAGAKGPGGVARRDADDPARAGAAEDGAPEAKYKMNPAIKLPQGIGLAPGVPKEEPPPKFETTEEEIAWYEAKLSRAETHLEMRRKATERLERWRKKAEESDDQAKLAQYDQRAEVVTENFKRAQKKVKDLEDKIAELRGK